MTYTAEYLEALAAHDAAQAAFDAFLPEYKRIEARARRSRTAKNVQAFRDADAVFEDYASACHAAQDALEAIEVYEPEPEREPEGVQIAMAF